MICYIELYIFADIQLLIFIIAFKNKAVKIKIWLGPGFGGGGPSFFFQHP